MLQDRGGAVVGIEVKAASSVQETDFSGLRALSDQFKRGIVFYTGETLAPIGPRLHAAPVAALWTALA